MKKSNEEIAKEIANIIYIQIGCELRHKHAEIILRELNRHFPKGTTENPGEIVRSTNYED